MIEAAMLRRRWFAAVFLVVSFLAPVASAQRPAKGQPDLATVDPIVAAMMAEWHVPGLALGVIKDGKVVYARGYGYRDLEAKLPVTPRTLMAIGSNSKSFTTVLLGMLVDEKKVEWDKPVRSYLPDFQMYDEYATTNLTPRDLVNHRSGLPRHDVLWYGRKFTRKEIFDRLRYLEPTTSFRNIWQYQNLMFLTAGYLEERLTGRSWEALIRERIFSPLGMTRSNTSVTDSPQADDFAWPYDWRDSTIVKIPFRNIDQVGPAGSINSSVEEMLKYLQFRIDLGAVGGKQLLSAEQAREMERPQMAMDQASSALWSGFDLVTYGLGVGVGSYRGHRTVIHGGGIDGFISQMSWLPDDRIGVVVLTNQGSDNSIPTLVVQAVYDRMLGLPPIDWSAKQRERDQIAAKAAADGVAKLAAERKSGTSPSHPLTGFAGAFTHPGYGTIEVRPSGAGLELVVDDMRARLEHYHFDTFKVVPGAESGMLQGLVSFLTNPRGEVDRIAVPLEPAIAPIVLRRIPQG